jgi:hypothetical protein
MSRLELVQWSVGDIKPLLSRFPKEGRMVREAEEIILQRLGGAVARKALAPAQ